MPTALVLELRPHEAGTVPAHLGRSAHAAVLRLLAETSAELARRLHDEEGPKPFTVSNVLGLDARGATADVVPEHVYGLRVTLLDVATERATAQWTAPAIGEIELDGRRWQVEHVVRDPAESPWAGAASYEELAGPTLLRPTSQASRWEMEFAAPVTFRQRGMNQPLPGADLVWGSLLDKWNAFAPMALPDEVRRFANECMAVSRFDLRSLGIPAKNGAVQIGAVGMCTYVATNRDRYWLACIETLARFAFFSGIGAATTRGFGMARLV